MALQPRFTIAKACQINLIKNYCRNYLLQCTKCAMYTFDVFIFVMPLPIPVVVTDPVGPRTPVWEPCTKLQV